MSAATPAWRLPDHFRDFLDGGEDVLREILEMFLADVPAQRARIAAAVAAGDALSLRREGHSLKGSCAQVGAEALASIASHWEHDPFEPASAQALLPIFDAEFAHVEQSMRASGVL